MKQLINLIMVTPDSPSLTHSVLGTSVLVCQ
jgi:hypothetical protein